MSSLPSPRPSTHLSSSRRTSIESSTATSRSASVTRPPAPEVQRRNRAALRDYYGLKSPQKEAESKVTPLEEPEPESELDKPGFDANAYVQHVLAHESLEGVLKTESNLVSGTSTQPVFLAQCQIPHD